MSMTPLGALIQECKNAFLDEHRVELTNGDIARRSGGRLIRQRVQQLASDEIKELPSPRTIAGLALGLGVSPGLVLQRALESCGYEVPQSLTMAPRKTVQADPVEPEPTEAEIDAEMESILAREAAAIRRRNGAPRPKPGG